MRTSCVLPIHFSDISPRKESLSSKCKQEFHRKLCPAWEGISVNHITATVRANKSLIFAHRLLILYTCTKICENISKGFRVFKRTQSAN